MQLKLFSIIIYHNYASCITLWFFFFLLPKREICFARHTGIYLTKTDENKTKVMSQLLWLQIKKQTNHKQTTPAPKNKGHLS